MSLVPSRTRCVPVALPPPPWGSNEEGAVMAPPHGGRSKEKGRWRRKEMKDDLYGLSFCLGHCSLTSVLGPLTAPPITCVLLLECGLDGRKLSQH